MAGSDTTGGVTEEVPVLPGTLDAWPWCRTFGYWDAARQANLASVRMATEQKGVTEGGRLFSRGRRMGEEDRKTLCCQSFAGFGQVVAAEVYGVVDATEVECGSVVFYWDVFVEQEGESYIFEAGDDVGRVVVPGDCIGWCMDRFKDGTETVAP